MYVIQCSLDIQPVNVGPDPTRIQCPSCKSDVVTKVTHKATTKTHLMAVLLCVFL